MNTRKSIAEAYDRAADAYAAALWNELEGKPFDRILLNWFETQIPEGETILEIGCGPGEVSGYLCALGAKCLGTDLSERMIENAKRLFPGVQFELQDFFSLSYPDSSFWGVVAFYAIVNLTLPEIELVLGEIRRVLKDDGILLFSFHIFDGEEQSEVANFFDQEGNRLTFYYFRVDEIKALVERAGYRIVDILIRYPYKDAEYQSKRAYFVARRGLG